MKKYKVTLTADERQSLHDLIAAGKASALKLAHARILLKADAAPGGPAWSDSRIAEAVEVSTDTVSLLRLTSMSVGIASWSRNRWSSDQRLAPSSSPGTPIS